MSVRIYDVDGNLYYSVTTILSLLSKESLIPWVAKMTAAEFKRLVVANMTPTLDELDEMEKLAKKNYRNASEQAMQYGTLIHSAIEEYCKTGIEPDLKDDPLEVQTAWGAWMAWVEEHDYEPVAQEVQVVNHNIGYAGRFDAIAKVDGVVTLIDFKSSTGIYDEMLYQLAAYWAALPEEYDDIEQAGILRLDKITGMPEWKVYTLDDLTYGWEVFRHVALAYRLIKGEPKPAKERKTK